MGTVGFVLLAVAAVVFVVVVFRVRDARRRRRARRSYVAQQTGDDDSPTGYVQGVWLLGGDAPKPLGPHPHDSDGGSAHHGGAGHDGGGSD
jgi:hypothetical protein